MNGKLLIEEIEKSRISQNHIAVVLGITRQALYKKLKGEREFKTSEVRKLAQLLNLTREKRDAIFFADFVDKMSTKQ